MIRFLFIWMLLLGTLMPSFAEAATPFSEKAAKLSGITAVRMAGSMERLRIVLDANKEVDYSVMVLTNPSRVVVDLHGAWLSPNVARETVIESRFASKVRVAQFNENTVRVVVETEMGKGQYDVFSIEGGAIPYRVVMDFGKVGRAKDDSHGGTITDDRIGSSPDGSSTDTTGTEKPETQGTETPKPQDTETSGKEGKEEKEETKEKEDGGKEKSGE